MEPKQQSDASQTAVEVSEELNKPFQHKVPSLWRELNGQDVVVQLKNKAIIKGHVTHTEYGLLRLVNVEIRGVKNAVKPEWVLIDRNSISHLHPVCEVEKV